MIIQNIISEGFQILKKNNIKSPLLDSEILMTKALGKKREYVILNIRNTLEKKKIKYFRHLINKRAKGKPVAYLLKKKSFWKYEFYVDENVLIPRPDTELIVEEVLNLTKNKKLLNILDIGIGSGCILLSVLKEKKGFRGTGIDINPNCLNACKNNISKLNIKNKIKLFNSDVDNFNNGKYDLIISNPPYIKKSNLKYLEKDVIEFEPRLALDGGFDGLSEIRKVINKSSELIKQNGKLVLEIGFDQKFEVKRLLKEKGFYINKVLRDFGKNDRCIISTKVRK